MRSKRLSSRPGGIEIHRSHTIAAGTWSISLSYALRDGSHGEPLGRGHDGCAGNGVIDVLVVAALGFAELSAPAPGFFPGKNLELY